MSRAAVRKPPRSPGKPPAGPNPHLRLLGLRPVATAELVREVEAGLPYSAFERLREVAGMSAEELAALVQVRPRTLARRRGGRFTPTESDRLVRAALVLAGAIELFEGDLDGARAWLATPAVALGGRPPRELAATEVGAREVERLLGRLEHGVFA